MYAKGLSDHSLLTDWISSHISHNLIINDLSHNESCMWLSINVYLPIHLVSYSIFDSSEGSDETVCRGV